MLPYVILGAGFGFAATVQPGPLQAFLLARAVTQGWRATLPAAFSPLLSDGPIALAVLLVVGRLPVTAQHALRVAGGILLLYFSWTAFRQSRIESAAVADAGDSGPRTLLQAALVNLLNPNPYIGWALVLGPAAASASRQRALYAVALIASFYGVIVIGLAAFICLAGTSRFLSDRGRRALSLVSALVLAGLAVYQLAAGIRGIAGG